MDPNPLNKLNESPIFLAAEQGSMHVLKILYGDQRTKVDLINKFGDTIMHLAARDGQYEALEYILVNTKKL